MTVTVNLTDSAIDVTGQLYSPALECTNNLGDNRPPRLQLRKTYCNPPGRPAMSCWVGLEEKDVPDILRALQEVFPTAVGVWLTDVVAARRASG